MADYRNPTGRYESAAPARTAGEIDEGLRAFMLRVYNYMAVGLGLTGLTAFLVAELSVTSDPAAAVGILERSGEPIFLTSLGSFLLSPNSFWIFLIAAFGFAMFLGSRLNQLKVGQAQAAFWAYAVVIGFAFSSIFLVYTSESIAQVFFITAAAFGGTSLFGYVTKTDLSRFRGFLMMGFIGIFIAIIVNWFLASEALMWAISMIGVVIFAGLTAFQTQRLKEIYYEGDSAVVAKAKAIEGALLLYVYFLYMFQFLLVLLGNRE